MASINFFLAKTFPSSFLIIFMWGTGTGELRDLTVKIFVHINTLNCWQSLSLHKNKTQRHWKIVIYWNQTTMSDAIRAKGDEKRWQLTLQTKRTRNYFMSCVLLEIRKNRFAISRRFLLANAPENSSDSMRKSTEENVKRTRNYL